MFNVKIINKIMKKLICIFLFITCFVSVSAQINYTKPEKPAYTILCNAITHFHYTDEYELSVRSNKYSSFINLSLGKGKEQAINSLKAIVLMYKDGKDDYRAELDGNTFIIVKKDNIKGLYTYKDYKKYYINIDEVNDYIKYLENEYKPTK